MLDEGLLEVDTFSWDHQRMIFTWASLVREHNKLFSDTGFSSTTKVLRNQTKSTSFFFFQPYISINLETNRCRIQVKLQIEPQDVDNWVEINLEKYS